MTRWKSGSEVTLSPDFLNQGRYFIALWAEARCLTACIIVSQLEVSVDCCSRHLENHTLTKYNLDSKNIKKIVHNLEICSENLLLLWDDRTASLSSVSSPHPCSPAQPAQPSRGDFPTGMLPSCSSAQKPSMAPTASKRKHI